MKKKNNKNSSTTDGFFEIIIKPKNNQKFSIKVKKEYTIYKVKEIIKTEKNMPPQNYVLAFKKPLKDENKTLEYYGINSTVTIQQISNVVGGK